MYQAASELYNKLLGTCFYKYYDVMDAERKNIKHEYKPKMVFLKP